MNKLLKLGKRLSKTEQCQVNGGHDVNTDCGRCSTIRYQCLAGCPVEDPGCSRDCVVDFTCCKSACAPAGGYLR